LVSGEPRGTKGTWVQVPNTTQAERNNLKNAALGLGASTFSGDEDVEIGPIDGKIYFTAKGLNRTYRFKDEGSKVSEFETYVGGRAYRINTSEGVVSEDWGGGNDNLTFDSKGNLYVLQDGSRDHIWLVKNGHTQAAPKVEIFMTTPKESEPTGMTFTPDNKFMFLSIQGPSPANTTVQYDAAGKPVVFNKATTIVIGLDSAFTKGPKAAYTVNDATQCLNGNQFQFNNTSQRSGDVNWNFGDNTNSAANNPSKTFTNAGNYQVKLSVNGKGNGCKDEITSGVSVYAKPAPITISGNTTSNNGNTENYNATNRSGSSYQWWIDNGNQMSGSNTSAISVKWNTSGNSGKVKSLETDANGCKGDTANLNITLTPSGNAPALNIPGFKLYPNPVMNELFVESDVDMKVVITDFKGNMILEIEKGAFDTKTIDLSSLTAGSYVVKVIYEQSVYNSHLIKIER
jgi:PKD repeat protein